MTLQQLQYFITVADTLNYTKAAETLFVTQSALSKQITALEEELGFPLLARSTKYVRLTPAGAVFVQQCREAMRRLDTAVDEADRASRGIEGRLRIGWLEAMNSQLFFREHIRKFRQKHPNVELALSCLSFSQLNAALEAGELDLIYTMEFNLQNMSGIVINRIAPGSLYILMSKEHPLAERESLCFADLLHETFFTPHGSKNENPETLLNRAGVHLGCRFRRELVANLETVFLHVELGHGVALIDDHLRILDDPHFVCKALDDEWLEGAAGNHPYSVMAWQKENLNPSLPLYTNLFL